MTQQLERGMQRRYLLGTKGYILILFYRGALPTSVVALLTSCLFTLALALFNYLF